MKKQHIKEIICRAKQGKKNYGKLNRAKKCSILGPQNLGSRGGPGPPGTPPGSASVIFCIFKPVTCDFYFLESEATQPTPKKDIASRTDRKTRAEEPGSVPKAESN